MNKEEIKSKITDLNKEERERAISILKRIKQMKEEGKRVGDKELLNEVLDFEEVLGR